MVSALQWLKIFPSLRKRYLKLAKYHDDLVNNSPEEALSRRIVIAEQPFETTLYEDTEVQRLNDLEKAKCPLFEDKHTGSCLEFNRRSDIAQLCQVMSSSLGIDLRHLMFT